MVAETVGQTVTDGKAKKNLKFSAIKERGITGWRSGSQTPCIQGPTISVMKKLWKLGD